VAGIYGPSANDDNASFLFYQEVLDTIGELQNTFQTRSLIMAGDFNAVLTPEDSSSEHVTKRRTTGILKKILEDYHLTDIATVANNKQHTWFRRNNNRVSSRLDLILTNLPVTRPKYVTSITIFDHAWVQASFGQKREQSTPSMKDYVLGSDEFLVNFYELLERRLTTCAENQQQTTKLASIVQTVAPTVNLTPTPRPHLLPTQGMILKPSKKTKMLIEIPWTMVSQLMISLQVELTCTLSMICSKN
jgi:hypothetical protein